MKLKYIFFAVILIALSGLIALAGTSSLKNDFFSAGSLLDANALKLFESTFARDKITKYDFEINKGDSSLKYTLYTEDFKTYFLESKDNFDFVIKLDKNVSELDIPWSLVDYFKNCKQYGRKYSSVYDGIMGVLKKNTDEDDFSLRTSIVNYNGLSRQNNTVILELEDSSVVASEVKKYFYSDVVAKMLGELYGTGCTSEQLKSITDDAVNTETGALSYKRSIVSDTVREETLSLEVGDNIFNMKAVNNVDGDIRDGSITVYDTKKTVDFSLKLAKNDEGESVVIKNGNTYTEIKAKDKNSITYFSKNENNETKMTVSMISDKKFGDSIYDASVSLQKNLMLCELSPWLTSNRNAAILFTTYEVDLKPLDIKLEDLKINFDE